MSETSLQSEQPPAPLVAMSSSFQTHVPVDAARFFVQTDDMALSEGRPHKHAIGDALESAQSIAENDPNASLTVVMESMRRSLTNGLRLPSEADLRSRTERKVRLYGGMAKTFGRRVEVVSSLHDIRNKPSVATRVADAMAPIYSDMSDGDFFDVSRLCELLGVKNSGGSDNRTLRMLAVDMLPKRYRSRNMKEAESLRKASYAATEGALAKAEIEDGGMYVSYRGNDQTDGRLKMTNIEIMRLLTQALIVRVLLNPGLAKEIQAKFVIDSSLDGHGLGMIEGSIVHNVCDPHTMDWGAAPPVTNGASSAESLEKMTSKLPFLIDEGGKYRPVLPAEFVDVVRDGTGGIHGPRAEVWLANFPMIDAYFKTDSARIGHIERALTPLGVKSGDVGVWLQHMRSARGNAKKMNLAVPAGNTLVAGEMVHMIAKDVVDSMYGTT